MTDATDPGTLRFYDGAAEDYVAMGEGRVSRHLDGFLDRLAPGARVLELGCGGGRDAEAMIARGFDVDPTDGSPEIARQAEARLGRPVRVMPFDQLDARAEYDGVFAHAALLHVPRAGLPRVFTAIHLALRPGGVFLSSFKAGEADGRDRLGRYYNYPSAAVLRATCDASGPWEELALLTYEGGGYDPGERLTWLALTLRKPG